MLRKLQALAPNTTAIEARQALRQELLDRIAVSAELPSSSFEISGPGGVRSIIALVGPPGAGKTITLAKLAVRYGLSAKRSTHIISYDSHRIASGDQLRAYAAVLGVSFEDLYTVDALSQSLKENVRKELILIDTPGYSASDFDLSADLSRFLSTYSHLDVHLVLSCALRSSDLSCMVERYQIFKPAKLLFTRLDETTSYGCIVNESARTGLPVSFLSAGPRVPEDIEASTRDRIVDLLLGGLETRAIASA
jgi:flagellar biosynthesis protein FlhF